MVLKPSWPLARLGTTDCANRYRVGPNLSAICFLRSSLHRERRAERRSNFSKRGEGKKKEQRGGLKRFSNVVRRLLLSRILLLYGATCHCGVRTKPLCRTVMMIYLRVRVTTENLQRVRIYLFLIQLRLQFFQDGLSSIRFQLSEIKSIAQRGGGV